MSNMPLIELSLCVKYSIKCQESHEDLMLALKEFTGNLPYLCTLLFIPHLKDKVRASTFPLPGLTITHDFLSWELACFSNSLLDLARLKEKQHKIDMPKPIPSLQSFPWHRSSGMECQINHSKTIHVCTTLLKFTQWFCITYRINSIMVLHNCLYIPNMSYWR